MEVAWRQTLLPYNQRGSRPYSAGSAAYCLSVCLFVCLSICLLGPRLRVTQKAARNAEFLLLLGTGAR